MAKPVIRIILVIIWSIFIFSMSAFQGEESSDMSQGVGYKICEVAYKNFDSLSSSEQKKIVKSIEHPIRKTAHFFEYSVLGLLVYLTLIHFNSKGSAILAWIVCTVYAASDELHQLFVSGRTPEFTDMCIDSAGAIAGIIFVVFLLKMLKKRHNFKY